MRVLFAGTPAVAVPSLNRLAQAEAAGADGLELVGVLTRPDARLGRKRVLTPSPVAARAVELGLPVIKAARITAEVTSDLAALAPDVAAIVAYGGLVPPAALEVPRHGWVNLHFSLLPAWRGAAPVQYSVLHGDDVVGASTFRLEEGLDTGPVYGTMAVTPRPDATAGDLLAELAESGAGLLARTLEGIADGSLVPRPQEGEPTYAPKLSLDDGRLDWSQPARALDRRARAVTPEPGAWTVLDGQRFKLEPPKLRPDVEGLEQGVLSWDGRVLLVGTATHALELVRVQPAGKKMMAAADWARGAWNTDGLRFG
ncbi:methionyl-tRNA formyltransferase [Sinomonas humi]|uniref:Methionyl-tRNA formyltransferase n=1 Tax=Sinomonas humi TaxID=1338436 RepID=A0A0B2AT66_9MICC|nr:methionyl-tRNA formyltransferase [Sinomonas humi]KHL05163.1 methionyl-tRNA formyltransferase [Sinomonas humi]